MSSMHKNATTPKNAATPRGSATPRVASRAASRGSNSNVIPVKALTLALEVCRDFLRCKEHLDIDEPINKVSFFQMFHIYSSILLMGTSWGQHLPGPSHTLVHTLFYLSWVEDHIPSSHLGCFPSLFPKFLLFSTKRAESQAVVREILCKRLEWKKWRIVSSRNSLLIWIIFLLHFNQLILKFQLTKWKVLF